MAVTSTHPHTTSVLHAERDACGIGFVAHTDGRPRRSVVKMALDGLAGVKHRGAIAADAKTGDGAGLLSQIPRELVADWAAELGAEDVDPAALGVAFLFLTPGDRPEDEAARTTSQQALVAACEQEGVHLLGFREVPTDPDAIGELARAAQPALVQ
ncbi:MAG: hypothetical protein ACLFRD_13095, partial [Nitriliruptoraceae bacterium]